MKYLRPATLSTLAILSCMSIRSAPKQTTGVNTNEKEAKLVRPEIIQGCYELGTLNWKPNLKLGEDEVFITPPQQIQLLSERGSKGFEANGYVVRPAPGSSPSIHRGSYWVPTGPDNIEIVFTTGLSGLIMELKVESGALVGKAKTHWDFPRRKQIARVTARKIDCDSTRH